MGACFDPEATPKPLEFLKNANIADRTPYIPRRKSSVGKRHDSGSQNLSTTVALEQTQRPTHVWPRHHSSITKSYGPKQEDRLSRASLSKLHPPRIVYSSAFAQSHHGLACPDRSSISSSESKSRGRLFSRIMSSFTHNNDSTQAISTVAKSFRPGHAQTSRLSGSTARDASLRTSSNTSTESTETSLVQIGHPRLPYADKPNSPNPLRAPPSDLVKDHGHGKNSSTDQGRLAVSSQPDEAPSPALATATLHSISDVANVDLEKATIVWIAVNVECSIHYAEDPTSTPRSRALGPPQTDPGFLTKLHLHLTPASGCSILRFVGPDNRDILLPGESWSVVAQLLAAPPFRRKQPAKAFSLQNRPSSHALMDQLHTFLSPSGPSSQALADVSVTFEHVLLPSTVQCCVGDKLSLERTNTRYLGSRRQYLWHRGSPQKTAPASEQEQRKVRGNVACKLLDVLELNFDVQGSEESSEAIEVLEEFFGQFEGSGRLHERARILLRDLEAKIRPVSRPPVSSTGARRDGLELSRESLQLQDVTNLWSGRSGDVKAPAPLFSPRKRPSVAKLHSPARGATAARREKHGGVDVGSPRFYEDEMDEASRIWRGMRDSSGGSSIYLGTGEDERHGDENERGVVGAPWL